MLTKHGANYFDSIRNWDAVKDKLLSIYGYSLKDDLTNKFEFAYENGRPFLRVLDNSIKRVATPTELAPKPSYFYKEPVAPAPVIVEDYIDTKPKLPEYKICLLYTSRCV